MSSDKFNVDAGMGVAVQRPSQAPSTPMVGALTGAVSIFKQYQQRQAEEEGQQERERLAQERAARAGGGSGGKPTESEKFYIGFSPFRNLAQDVLQSDLSPNEKAKKLRQIKTQAILALPQYESRISGVFEEFGVGGTPETPQYETVIQQALTDFVQSPEGQAAAVASMVVTDTGQVDIEATQQNLQSEFFKRQALQARIDASQQELSLIEANKELRDNRASQIASEISGEWATTVSTSVANMSNIIQNPELSVADPEIQKFSTAIRSNDYESAVNFLSMRKLSLEESVRQDLLNAGIPVEIVNKKVDEVMRPLNNIIDFMESKPERLEDALKVADLQARQQISEQLLPKFGEMAKIKAFQDAIFRNYTMMDYERIADVVASLSAVNDRTPFDYTTTMKDVKSPEKSFAEMEDKAMEEGAPEKIVADTVSLVAKSLNTPLKEDKDSMVSLVSRWSEMNEGLKKSNMPMSPKMLGEVLSSTSIANIKEVMRRDDQTSSAAKMAFTEFVSNQFWNNWFKNINNQIPENTVVYVNDEGKLSVRRIVFTGAPGTASQVIDVDTDQELREGPRDMQQSIDNINMLLDAAKEASPMVYDLLSQKLNEVTVPNEQQVEAYRKNFIFEIDRKIKPKTFEKNNLYRYLEAETNGFYNMIPVRSEGLKAKIGNELDTPSVNKLVNYLDRMFVEKGVNNPDAADIWLAVNAPNKLGKSLDTEVRDGVTVADVKNMFGVMEGTLPADQQQEQQQPSSISKLNPEKADKEIIDALKENGVDPDKVFVPSSDAELEEAIRRGVVNEGDFVLTDQGVFKVSKETIDSVRK